MDKKTTRRIIGVLVMIAMVIIVLPLLVNGRPGLSSSTMAEVKAPPFPEPRNETDPIPASMIAKNNAAKTVITSTGNKHSYTTETSFAASPLVTSALEAKEQIDKAEQAAISTDPKVSAATATADEKVYLIDSKGVVTPSSESGSIVKMAAAVMGLKKAPEAPAQVNAGLKPAAKTKPAVVPAPVAVTAKAATDSLDNLKKSAWVVQLGVFKNKDNAIRLTNMLRAKGFKAFTRDMKHNTLTGVYVGPEFKQALASTLVSRIQQDVKMRGVVVNFKPLEL